MLGQYFFPLRDTFAQGKAVETTGSVENKTVNKELP